MSEFFCSFYERFFFDSCVVFIRFSTFLFVLRTIFSLFVFQFFRLSVFSCFPESFYTRPTFFSFVLFFSFLLFFRFISIVFVFIFFIFILVFRCENLLCC